MKIGRNEPCPCGSGKKYKKCCGLKVSEPMPSLELEEKTGTVWDEYMMLSKVVIVYGQGQRQFAQDKKELNKRYNELERRFRPGEAGGILDSFFMTMFHFDIAYGKEQKTIIEWFLEEDVARGLNTPGLEFLKHLRDSYCAMYEVLEKKGDVLTLADIMTGRQYAVTCLGQRHEDEARPGEIWYVRLAGPPQQAVTLTTPYVFEAAAKKSFQEIMNGQKRTFKKMTDTKDMPEEEIYRQACKTAVGFWAAYMTAPWQREVSLPPVAANTDHQRLIFCRLMMTVRDVSSVKRALDGFQEAVFDEHPGHWIWQKRRQTKRMLGENIILADISVENGKLAAMTNSMQRALRLKRKLLTLCGEALVYEKIEAITPEAMPEPTAAQMEQFEKEQKAILSDPLVRQSAEKRICDYYFKSWVRQKIPMLGLKTPLAASKTPQGREDLKELFARMEGLSAAVPGEAIAKMDFQQLKKKLGIG